MHIVIRYKKYGLLRFLSAIETANAIERHLRRSGLDIVFTQGFHKKPKISYIDPTPTGVVNLSLYVRISVKEFQECLLEKLKQTALAQLYPVNLWWTEVDPNKLVTAYKYRVLVSRDAVDFSQYDQQKTINVGKKVGQMKDFFVDVKCESLGDILLIEYTQMRNKMLHPSCLYEPLLIREPSVLVVQRTEALCNGMPLSEILEGGLNEKGSCGR